MDHLIGIFILWSIGMAIAIVVFIGEVLIGKLKRAKEMEKKITFII